MTSIAPPLCRWCKHRQPTGCAAFASIPNDIFTGAADHRDPYPNDHGIRFEAGPVPPPEVVTDMLDLVARAKADPTAQG